MKTDKPPTHTADWLKWLGERRDGFLIGGAVLYGLGYLVWSYNAWRNHLGQLPAIEFQYLMSGLIPGAVIGMTWAAIRFFSRIQGTVIVLFEKYRFLRWLSPVVVFGVFFLTLNLVAVDKRWLHLGWTKNNLFAIRPHYCWPYCISR